MIAGAWAAAAISAQLFAIRKYNRLLAAFGDDGVLCVLGAPPHAPRPPVRPRPCPRLGRKASATVGEDGGGGCWGGRRRRLLLTDSAATAVGSCGLCVSWERRRA
jgi:hypothetical protein